MLDQNHLQLIEEVVDPFEQKALRQIKLLVIELHRNGGLSTEQVAKIMSA